MQITTSTILSNIISFYYLLIGQLFWDGTWESSEKSCNAMQLKFKIIKLNKKKAKIK